MHEYRVGVKGLFALPLALVREEYRLYERRPLSTGDAAACAERMREALAESVEGEILRFAPTAAEKDGLTYVSVRAWCRENIAKTAVLAPASPSP